MSKLLDYLTLLDKDATARQAHNKDPKAAMTRYGLSEAKQKALLSGNKAAIAKLAGIDEAALPSVQVGNTDFNPR